MKKYLSAEEIQLVFSGHNYFELLEEIIEKSKNTLHLQTYIFASDETGKRIIEALKRAAVRHVDVYVLLDAFGSNSFSKEMTHELASSGVHFRKFSPVFSSESGYFGRRMHHKIVVADKTSAMIGGINIANKYNSTSKSEPWLDYAILIKGNVCEYLHLLCEKGYKRHTVRAINKWENNTPIQYAGKTNLIRFRINDFIKGKNEIHQSYVEGLKKARTSITIVASYFLPGKGFRKLLAQASARGVVVKIILGGQSDAASVRLAENYLYDFLLRNNIHLYEWTNSVLHGKAMIVDDNWATVGSYNLNFLSHYISMELNADIIDTVFIKEFSTHLDEIMENDCRHVDLNLPGQRKNIFSRFKMWLAYSFFRILMIATVNKKRK